MGSAVSGAHLAKHEAEEMVCRFRRGDGEDEFGEIRIEGQTLEGPGQTEVFPNRHLHDVTEMGVGERRAL
jgi:hypothetical protein